MGAVTSLVTSLQPFIFFILLGLALWLFLLSFFLFRSLRHYKHLTYGITKKDLKTILNKLLQQSQASQKEINALKKNLQGLQEDGKLHLQKIGFIRYNPFRDTGGDQSFCLSLLDRRDNGIVISSLHSRDQTRIYAKKIIQGKSPGYSLSKEEQEAVKRAQSWPS
jgi:hypothetical protein